jgi:hypothetical protein
MDAPSTSWINNAVKAAGRAEGSGQNYFDLATGKFDSGINKVKRNSRGRLPNLNDLAQLKYLADLGFIDAHQDKTIVAALQHYLDAPDAFYIGIGLMKHWISPTQLTIIRSLLIDDAHKAAFDAAVSLQIGRVGSPLVAPKETVFGCDGCFEFGVDAGDVEKAKDVSDKLADGDYGGAAEDAGGDIAKGAAIGASIAAATAAGGSIAIAATATGAAIGTAIPIPVVGTAAGAAIGATVAAAIILGNVIFGSKPMFSEDDYNRMRKRCDEGFGGGNHETGVPSDNYGGCKYKDGSQSGGDWPFPGTWNHEIRDWGAYKRNWDAYCQSVGGTAEYNYGPGKRGVCAFPDGYRTDGGEFWKAEWPPEKQAEYQADQAARQLQYTNLGSYVNGLKQIDKMYTAADQAMRKPGATYAQRDIWMKKIGDAFAKIYLSTGQDHYAPLNVAGFVNDPFNQRRVFSPTKPPAFLIPKGGVSKMLISKPTAGKPAMLPTPPAFAGAMITRGLIAAAPAQKEATAQPLVAPTASPDTRAAVSTTIANVQEAKQKGIVRKILEFLHIVKKSA